MISVICCTTLSILSDRYSEPIIFDDVRSLWLKQQEPREILMNERDDENFDDEFYNNKSFSDELLLVKDILEEILTSKPDVIDLTFDSEFEVSQL
jgi:hypothetical protein